MSVIAYELPFYGNGLRADDLAAALQELTPQVLRLGALEARVVRSREDAYKFRMSILVPDKVTWQRLWNSKELIAFRTIHSNLYQKPLNYEINIPIAHGRAPGVLDPYADEPFGPAKAEDDPRITGMPAPTGSG
jgi:hypothetical protein